MLKIRHFYKMADFLNFMPLNYERKSPLVGVGAKPVFAPTLFLAKKLVARRLAPPLSQKITPRFGYSGG